ncbi:MAG: endonuclease III domain-containing protein [Candidatus Aenigmarchaeota archaeon]|nr:endonuclease III domain-containing protein [Candidatus Aenigmarchaeota archaeon]
MKNRIQQIYGRLLKHYGKQDWWPVRRSFEPEWFEICVGAVLAQNTSWKNVDKALDGLMREGMTSPSAVLKADPDKLKKAIRPSGFYNQKAERLKILSTLILDSGIDNFQQKMTRESLLSARGIGKETADSILLYACDRPVFVVDAYTKRIFSRIGLMEEKLEYEKIRELFENAIEKDSGLFREYHALIVEHAKQTCGKEPLCRECCLLQVCKYGKGKANQ